MARYVQTGGNEWKKRSLDIRTLMFRSKTTHLTEQGLEIQHLDHHNIFLFTVSLSVLLQRSSIKIHNKQTFGNVKIHYLLLLPQCRNHVQLTYDGKT